MAARAWLNGWSSSRASSTASCPRSQGRLREAEAPKRVRLPGPCDDRVVQALRFLKALKLSGSRRSGASSSARSTASWNRPSCNRAPASIAKDGAGGFAARGLPEQAGRLVRDVLHLLETALDDTQRLHPVEDLRPLRVVADGVAESEGAAQHLLQLRAPRIPW